MFNAVEKFAARGTEGPAGGELFRNFLLFAFAAACVAMIVITLERNVMIADWPLEVSGFPAFRDFANLWAGGIAATNGTFDMLLTPVSHSEHLARQLAIPTPALYWSYPPTAMLLALPFAQLPYAAAVALWLALSMSAFFAACGGFGSDWRAGALRLAAIAFCPGVFLCVVYGQTALLTSAALFFGIHYAKNKPVAAGAIFALLAAKPQIALVVPVVLLALGAWRAIFATAVWGVAFIVATVAVLGTAPWHLFLDATVPQQVKILNDGLYDICMLISPFTFIRALGGSIGLSYGVQSAVTLSVMAWLFIALRRERDANIRFVMVASAVLLCSPYMQTYELPILVIAVVRVFADNATADAIGDAWLKSLAAAVTVVPFFVLTVLMSADINFLLFIPLTLLVGLGLRALMPGAQATDARIGIGARRSA